MYTSIYLPLDNSAHSLAGVEVALALARQTGAKLTGCHVYAAKLHDRRFRQMEGGLPEPYRKEDKLVEQRDIHDDLITRGLAVISDSFLDVFADRCTAAQVAYEGRSLEGKNWQRLVEDIEASDCDLVVMGALGLGAVPASQLGSVCERVARRTSRDLLVMRDTEPREDDAIVVALDGSPQSYGGLMTAIALGKVLGRPVEAVAAFDPHFHYVAFNSIARVLSDEAASVFRFQEQEKLHEEIIDSGLAKIYQGHLDVAARIARKEGIELSTKLLAGKAFEQLLLHVRETRPWLLVLGRIGVHSETGMDLGSATENLLRLAPCNLLLSARAFEPPLDDIAETTMSWTDEAEARMARVPEFVRGMARKAVICHAAERGHTVVTSDVIDTLLANFMPVGGGSHAAGSSVGKCPFADDRGTAAMALPWDADALARLERIEPEALREHARLRIEKMARGERAERVTVAHVETASRAVASMLG